MNWFEFLTHALEVGILLPCTYMAIMPVRNWLYFPKRIVYVVTFLACVLLAVAGGLACAALSWPSYIFLLLCLPGCCVVYCALSSLEVEKKLFCYFNAALMGAYATVFTKVLMAPYEVNNTSGALLPITSFICLVVMEMIMVLFDNTLTVKLPSLIGEHLFDKAWRLLWLAPLLLTIFLIWTSPFSSTVLLTGRVRVVSLGFLLFMLLAIWVIYHLFWQMNVSLSKSERLRQDGDLFAMERKRYAELREYMQQTRALRHDFRHHLVTIDELARSGNTEALTEYLAPLTATVHQSYPQLCANTAVDALAAHYAQQAELQGTRVDWKLSLAERLPVEESDVCSVLGNLVENALNAVRELPVEERKVEVTASMPSDALLGITVKNPYKGTVNLTKRGLLRRVRGGRGEHGVGLMSVDMIARRHHGTFEVTAKDGRFEAGVLLLGSHEG